MTPEQSAERAQQIAKMPPGNFRHRCFDDLINSIASEHGHGEAVAIFDAVAAPDHYDIEQAPFSALQLLTGKTSDEWREIKELKA
jgi:hypothetical protein